MQATLAPRRRATREDLICLNGHGMVVTSIYHEIDLWMSWPAVAVDVANPLAVLYDAEDPFNKTDLPKLLPAIDDPEAEAIMVPEDVRLNTFEETSTNDVPEFICDIPVTTAVPPNR